MGLSKTELLLMIGFFYGLLFVFFEAYGYTAETAFIVNNQSNINETFNEFNYSAKMDVNPAGAYKFFSGFLYTFNNIPPVLNIIIFLPLIAITIWILVTTFIPTVNSGS